MFLSGNLRLESSNPRKFGQNWAGKRRQKLNQHLRQDLVGSKPPKTLQNDRSIQRQIGDVFWEIFEFMVDRRKIEGKFVINLALDTNMLWGNPLGWPDLSRIFAGTEGKAVEGGEGMKSSNTRTRRTRRTHAHKSRYTPITHAGGNRSNIIPRIGVGRSSLSTPTTGDEVLGEILTTWGRETENPRPCTT